MKKTSAILITFFSLITISFSQSIQEYYLYCNPDDFKFIYENYVEDNYISCTLTYKETTWTDIRLRIRGDDSRSLPKKSLKLKFDGEPFVNGRNTLNFNAEYLDHSYMQQFLSSRLFRQTNHPCYTAEHARLYVNDSFLGLYLQIENIDEDFLTSWNLDPNGNLYKATVDWACLNRRDTVELWEKKTNNDGNFDDLFELIREINSVPDELYYKFAKKWLDYNNMININALNILVANGSTWYHNYHVFHDINFTGKWLMTPWDMDKTFASYGAGHPFDLSSGIWVPDNPWLERALICPPIFNDIKSRINEIAEEYFNSNNINPVIDSLRLALESSVLEDTTDGIPDLDFWKNVVNSEKAFVPLRIKYVNKCMTEWPTNFSVVPHPQIFGNSVRFMWRPSKSRLGHSITYRLSVSPYGNYQDKEAVVINNLTDTTFTIDTLKPGRLYYYMVEAIDSVYTVVGFDSRNEFFLKSEELLPCEFTGKVKLTREKSPYLIDCAALVPDGSELIIEDGVEIRFSKKGSLTVNGTINAIGKDRSPVRFVSDFRSDTLVKFLFNEADDKCRFEYVYIEDCKFEIIHTQLDLKYSTFNYYKNLRVTDVVFDSFYKTSTMRNCKIFGSGKGEGFLFRYQDSSIVENCEFYNLPDAIEYIKVNHGFIKNNFIYNPGDDCIDLNACKDILITKNTVYNATDKGISVGTDDDYPSENISVVYNSIIGCFRGISVKDESEADIINNTFFNNKTAIDCYVKYPGWGGGIANVKNCIFSQSETDIKFDSKSTVTVSYSLSDKAIIPGEGNILGNPLFKEPDADDFSLLPESPAIDAGSPDSPLDPDGSRCDMGAVPSLNFVPKIVINEINYNSAPEFDSEDWVELYNYDNKVVDLSGWRLYDDNLSNMFVIPDGVTLSPNKYLVLLRDSVLFGKQFPDVNNFLGNFDFGLSGSGDIVRLFDSKGRLADSVAFLDDKPWPNEADGKGASMELIKPSLDNNLPESWTASIGHGSPGRKNGKFDSIMPELVVRDFSLSDCVPNPFNETADIQFELYKPASVRLTVYNATGKEVMELVNAQLPAGNYNVSIDGNKLSAGFYFIRIETDFGSEVKGFVKLSSN